MDEEKNGSDPASMMAAWAAKQKKKTSGEVADIKEEPIEPKPDEAAGEKQAEPIEPLEESPEIEKTKPEPKKKKSSKKKSEKKKNPDYEEPSEEPVEDVVSAEPVDEAIEPSIKENDVEEPVDQIPQEVEKVPNKVTAPKIDSTVEEDSFTEEQHVDSFKKTTGKSPLPTILGVIVILLAIALVYSYTSCESSGTSTVLPEDEKSCATISGNQDECLGMVAFKKNDAGLCDGIQDDKIKRRCIRSFIGSPQNSKTLCEMIDPTADNIKMADECYYIAALQAGDAALCDKILGTGWRDKDECFYRVAQQAGDIDYCDRIEKKLWRDPCLRVLTSVVKEPTLCHEIGDLEIKDACYHDAAKKNNDSSVCEDISDEQRKDRCFNDIAQITFLAADCRLISQEALQTDCLLAVAVENADLSICDGFTDKVLKDECYEKIINL